MSDQDRQTPPAKKVKKQRYCGMCDEWMPARHRECPKCGFEMSKPVVDLMDALRRSLDASAKAEGR